MNNYLASSWRNPYHCVILKGLVDLGYEVYDFKNPAPGNTGFKWPEVGLDGLTWDAAHYVECLEHPVAQAAFALDKGAIDRCDVLVLLLPCGKSAHLEAGYAAGKGIPVYVLIDDNAEPELMYNLLTGFATSFVDLVKMLPRPCRTCGRPSEPGIAHCTECQFSASGAYG